MLQASFEVCVCVGGRGWGVGGGLHAVGHLHMLY